MLFLFGYSGSSNIDSWGLLLVAISNPKCQYSMTHLSLWGSFSKSRLTQTQDAYLFLFLFFLHLAGSWHASDKNNFHFDFSHLIVWRGWSTADAPSCPLRIRKHARSSQISAVQLICSLTAPSISSHASAHSPACLHSHHAPVPGRCTCSNGKSGQYSKTIYLIYCWFCCSASHQNRSLSLLESIFIYLTVRVRFFFFF